MSWSAFCLPVMSPKRCPQLRTQSLFRALLVGLVTQSMLMLAQVAGVLGTIDLYGLKARAEFAGDSRVSGTLGSPIQRRPTSP